MSEIKGKVDQANQHFNLLNEDYSTGSCWRLSSTLQELEDFLREHIQEVTKPEITKVIHKLKAGQTLDKHEIEYVKLWLVGDANYYVQMENNHQDWIDELNRLMGEIAKVDLEPLDFVASSRLRAMVLDGIRVIGDIMFFLKQKERIKNFTESTEEINPQERDLLIRLLEGKFYSPNE